MMGASDSMMSLEKSLMRCSIKYNGYACCFRVLWYPFASTHLRSHRAAVNRCPSARWLYPSCNQNASKPGDVQNEAEQAPTPLHTCWFAGKHRVSTFAWLTDWILTMLSKFILQRNTVTFFASCSMKWCSGSRIFRIIGANQVFCFVLFFIKVQKSEEIFIVKRWTAHRDEMCLCRNAQWP